MGRMIKGFKGRIVNGRNDGWEEWLMAKMDDGKNG